ncbi:MAG: glycosyltransferase family 39 protein, partial [Bacteroidota bacterium]
MLQAALSPLDADEAYYWMYAHQLDWGYFDHPPAVAALIKFGMWLPGELGVRLGHVLISGLTVSVIWQILGRPKGRDMWIAALLIAIQPMLQVYGFIATPDGPLLLFTALFLWRFKVYLQSPTVQNGLWIGLIMAGSLYSKYHGLLLIIFMIIPNLGFLVRQSSAWIAVGFGVLLYLPHLYWQYVHDFPSFRYHLSGRNDPYQLKYTTEFLLNQVLIFNPFLWFFYFKSLFGKSRVQAGASIDQRFLQSCRWLVFLTLGFFLYSTSRGGAEPQWTATIVVSLIFLVYHGLQKNSSWRKPLLRIGYLSLVLFFLARIILVLPRQWLPFKKPF